MSVEINASDIVRLIEQYLKENNLPRTLATLQDETHIPYNAVENLDTFRQDIMNGNWDIVLQTLAFSRIPHQKSVIVYEQIFLELIEMKELSLARLFLRQMEPFSYLKENDPPKYIKLEQLLGLPNVHLSHYYGPHASKEKRRSEIAQWLSDEMYVIPSSRLLSLLHQALQFQQTQGLIPKSGLMDLLSQRVDQEPKKSQILPSTCYATIQFEKESCPHTALFTQEHDYFVTGTADGFIEVWDYRTGKLRDDLPYQSSEGGGLVMDRAIFALAVNKDGDLLISGSESGDIIIWHLGHGQIVIKYPKAHEGGVSHLAFSRDGNQFLSCGYDRIVRIYGLKTTQPLKEFRGHTSFVNSAIYTPDANRMMSSCSDGTIKIWDIKTTECLMTITPRRDLNVLGSSLMNVPIYHLIRIPKKDQFIVVCRSSIVPIVSSHGMTVNILQSGSSSDFIAGCLSANGHYYMTIAEDYFMYCFDLDSGSLVNKIKVVKSEVVGLCQHPSSNVLAIFDRDGLVQFWK